MPPLVSVIIPVYNDSQRLKKCLQALEKQTYSKEKYEVLVVDNASEENLKDVVEYFSQAWLTVETCPGSYAARNKGISVAQGEILAFTDADCVPSENWIEAGVKCLLSLPGPGIVAGKIEMFFQDKNYPNIAELYDSITNLNQKKIVEQSHFGATANLFTFKKVFDEVGLFNQQLKSGGDSEWGKRAFSKGYLIEYAEESCIAHPARNSFAQLYKKNIRVKGGFYELEKIQNQGGKKIFLKELLQVISRYKPPIVYAARKSFSEEKASSNVQKIQLFLITLVLHYAGVIERTRLILGGKPQR